MARLTTEQLDNIKQKYNVNKIWSWSRVNTFMTSPYEYYLKYVIKAKEDRTDCCYTTLGTICHDTLDNYYENKIPYEKMIDNFEDGWLTAIEIADLKFDRNDETKNSNIARKYKTDLQHFFKNHTKYKYPLSIEKPVVINVDNNIFVGYIDAIYKDDDDVYHIIDFKTSTQYTGKNPRISNSFHYSQCIASCCISDAVSCVPLCINIQFNKHKALYPPNGNILFSITFMAVIKS